MFQRFAKIAQEQQQKNQINQVTNVIELFIRNIRNLSNNEVNISNSLALKNWFLQKSKEEKFQIVERFLKEFYTDLYR